MKLPLALTHISTSLALATAPFAFSADPATPQLAPPPLAKSDVLPPGPSATSAPSTIHTDASGTWVRNMELNDILAVLAKRAKLQFFANPSLDGKLVNGHVIEGGDPVEQMRGICLQYGISLYHKVGTVYALDEKQVAALPRKEWVYTVKYLRGHSDDDQKRLLELIKPALSERGQARYEDKTGTLVVIDNDAAIESVSRILERVDQAKKQVIVQVRILRLQNTRAKRSGVDWSGMLGKSGLALSATAQGQISELFGVSPIFQAASSAVGTTGATGATTAGGIVLDPLTVSVVLRAINEGNLASQTNAPSVITEDNEQAFIRITDRIPIIEQTASQSAGVNQITTDVRYRIDKSDSMEPDKSREIGVTVSVTPSLLPDGTIRMKMFPRVASVTEFVDIQTGVAGVVNKVPRVGEASVETIARIPNGYTLFLGGYYQTEETTKDTKVPFLGDIPGLSFVFRSKQREKTKSNVVFMLTPTAYDPASPYESVAQSERLRQQNVTPKRLDYPDDENPGENEVPRPAARARNFFGFGSSKPKPPVHPLSEDSLKNERRVETPQERRQREIQAGLR